MSEPIAASAGSASEGARLLAWLDRALAALRAGDWGRVAAQSDVDVYEALRAEYYFRGLTFLRDGRAPHLGRPILAGLAARARAGAARARDAVIERRYRRYSAAPQHGGVFFWPREPTHVKMLLPVAAALEKQGRPARFVACQPKVLRQLKSARREVMFLPSLWRDALAEVRAAARRRAERLRRLPRPKVAGEGLSPHVRPEGLLELICWLTVKNLPAVESSAFFARQMFDELAAGVLVVGSDVTYEGRTACQVAASRRRPTACLMHGSVSGSALHGHHIVDRYFVYGPSAQRTLVELGTPAEIIRVCGAPYLDECPRQSGQIHPAIAERLQFDDRRPYVLVATSGPGNSVSHGHHRRQIDALASASRELVETQFAVKLHRKDREEYYEHLASAVPGARLKIIPNQTPGYPADIFDWLQGADLLVTSASTTSIEAMLLDVPVVTMDFASELHNVDFIDQGATTHVTSPAELIEAIRRLTGSAHEASAARDKADAYLRDVFLAVDGRSSERIAAELVEMLGDH